MRKTHTSTAVKSRYNEKAYDRFLVTVKKGEKDDIQQCAQSVGMSLNGFIVQAINEHMQRVKDTN